MINNLEIILTLENIYLISNFGILPFWMMLIFIPNHNLTKILVHSIVPFLILASAYIFVGYKIFLEKNFYDSFDLYFGLEGLYSVYSNESFLLIFWLHFLSISLFTGSWIARDSIKYSIPKIITILSLVLTYFTGPIGVIFYWFFRIFFSKKISFYE